MFEEMVRRCHAVAMAVSIVLAMVFAARAADDGAITIGALLAYGGPQPEISAEVARGLALALDEAGRQVAGRPIVLREVDTQGDPVAASVLARELIVDHGVDILVGPMSSAESLAVRDVVHELGVPLLVPNSPLTALTAEKCSPFLLRLSYAPDQVAGPLGAWLAIKGKAKRAYLLAPDSPLGRDMLAAFSRQFTAAGGEVVGEELVPVQKREFEAYIAKLRLVGADSVFAFFGGETARALYAAFDESKLAPGVRLLAIGAVPPAVNVAQTNIVGAGVTLAMTYFAQNDAPPSRAFAEAYQARFGRVPTEQAAHGYDSGKLLVGALAETRGNAKNRRALATIMGRMAFDGARGAVRLDPRTNNIVQDVFIAKTRLVAGALGYDVLDRLPMMVQPVQGCAMAGP